MKGNKPNQYVTTIIIASFNEQNRIIWGFYEILIENILFKNIEIILQ